MEHRAHGAGSSAPTQAGPELPPAGWYDDPHGALGFERWWTGAQWTGQTRFFPPPPIPATQNEPHLASYGSRLGGYLIDGVILLALSAVLLVPFGGLIHRSTITMGNATGHVTRLGPTGFGILVQAALYLLYATLFIGWRGQTPGMMTLGTHCVTAEAGTSVGHVKAFLRALVEFILGVLVIPWVIDMLFPLWDGRNQTIHDKAVRSLVISGARRPH